jgi:uncharacterized membrane protein
MEDLKKDAEDNKIMGILAYLGILFLVPYLAAKESPFARFHANQGCVLFIVAIALWIVSTICAFIPYIGWLLSLLIWLLYMGIFVLMIIGIINAVKGEMKQLPLIGKYTILK